MRAVVQRVRKGEVSVDGKTVAKIEKGYVVLLGVCEGDSEEDADFVAKKVANLRVFQDERGKMGASLKDVGGKVLLVSQFTLCADLKKGNRPSFTKAASPDLARRLYERVAEGIKSYGVEVETGIFGAYMLVKIENDGPVTIILDSKVRRGEVGQDS